MKVVILNGCNLTMQEVWDVAYNYAEVRIAKEAYASVEKAHSFLQNEVNSGKTIYGVNTGFGQLASVRIENPLDAVEMQRRLVISHAVGVGKTLEIPIIRAIVLIRLNTQLAGHSGVAKTTIRLLQQFLNKRIHPVIPEQGSVGASGDLCPLSHIACALIGVGDVLVEFAHLNNGEPTLMPAKDALNHFQLLPLELGYKEGLALINGTSYMAALGAIACIKARNVLQTAEICTAIATEALCGRLEAFDARIHQVRRHKGQIKTAENLLELLKNSQFAGIQSEALAQLKPQNETPETLDWCKTTVLEKFIKQKSIPQDAYSIRCSPQVLGASRTALKHVRQIIDAELNAVVDNPLIFVGVNGSGSILSGGNFHGQPIAIALDYLKLSMAEIGNLIERQVNKLLDPATNDSLPPFLAAIPGMNSGLMIAQYTAASLVSENKVLVHPASADSIPTSANQEDHVSMGPIAGRQALEIIHNVEKVLAIHLLTSTQALDMRRLQLVQWGLTDPQSAPKVAKITKKVRSLVPYLHEDRYLHPDINTIIEALPDIYELGG